MMAYFDFKRLITKYGRDFTVIVPSEGAYVGGVWQDGEPVRLALFGAIISLSESKLYQLGGTLTAQDRHLYMLEPINAPLKGARVEFEGNTYHIEQDRANGNEVFTGVWSYTLKWVSAIDRP